MTLMDVQTAQSLLNFAENIAPKLRGLESHAQLEQLERKYGDLKLAIWWFIEQQCATEALRIANSLVAFWMATKRLDEGSIWFDQALAVPGGDDFQRGRALFEAGYLAFWKGDYDRSSILHNQAIELGRQTKDPTVTALALVGLARIALKKDIEVARQLCREALALTKGTADQAGRSSAMHVLGVAAQMTGDFLEARELMSQRIALARKQGNLATVSSECGNLCMVERQLGNLDEAEALGREALEIDYQRGDELAIPWKINGLAAVAADRGTFERAANLIGAADVTTEATGGAWPPDELAQYEQTVITLTAALGPVEFERARTVGYSMTSAEAVAFALAPQSAGQEKSR